MERLLTPPPTPSGMTAAELAEKLGVSQQAVSDWVHGVRVPKAKVLAQIEDILKIPMRAWTLEEEKPDENSISR